VENARIPSAVELGSASNNVRPNPRLLAALLEASPWFLATDADPAGDLALGGWPRGIRRVRPPAPWKDWTEAFQGGLDLREWWLKEFNGAGAPSP